MTQEIRLAQTAEVRAVNSVERTIDIVASDSSIDSYQTRIDQSGWDLEQFKRNPVILFAHNDRTFAAAKAVPETIRVENGELKMRIKFPEAGISEEHDLACYLYSNGYMRGISVGFMALAHRDVTEGEGDTKRSVRIYTKARLLEVSLVAIPSNDNAFAQRCVDLNADKELVLTRARRFEELIDSQPKHSSEYVEKCIGYFERKQPANKASTRFLKKFFKTRGEDLPTDEVDAWERAEEIIESNTVTVETPSENTITETPKVEPAADVPEIEEKPEETPPEAAPELPSTPTESEAPARGRTASVQLSMQVLQALPRSVGQTVARAAVEALRRGVPVKDLGDLLDAVDHEVQSQLIPH